MANDFFWSLKKEIDDEYHSLCLDLSSITDDDLSDSLYIRFSRQIDHLQDLFDRISEVNKDLDLDQSNPEFYKLLEGKQALSDCYGQFNRQRSIFFKRFAKFREKEEDVVQEHVSPENLQEDNEASEEPLVDLPEEEADWEEEFDPEAEKQAKQAERKARQKKLAADAKKRQDARYAEQRLREEESRRLGMNVRPEQSVSEADLYQERIRQEEARRMEADRAAARLREEDEAMRRTNERIKQSEQFEHLESHHIDMSREGIGEHGAVSSQTPEHISSTPISTSPEPVYGVFQPETQQYQHAENFRQETESPSGGSHQIPSSASESFTPHHTDNPHEHNQPDIQQIRREEATRLGMDVRPGQSVSEADLYQARIRQEDAERLNKEQAEHRRRDQDAAMRHTRERVERSEQFEHLQGSHIDMSREGIGARADGTRQSPESSSVPPISPSSFVPHSFTPTGIAGNPPETSGFGTHSTDSNAKIYSALMSNRSLEDKDPITVSPVFETQMRFNVERARFSYLDARGTPAAQEAAREYLHQRKTLSEYRDSVKQGIIQVSQPPASVVPNPEPSFPQKRSSRSVNTGNNTAVYSFTPSGTSAQTITNGHFTGNRYDFVNPGLRSRPAYSPSNPMVVSPKYEEAITGKMRSTAELLNSAIAKGDPKAQSVNPLEAKMYSDAYFAFQHAKREGSVIVSDNGDGPDIPDYFAWQQRRQAQSLKPLSGGALGSTGQSKGPNLNKTAKKTVEEPTANIFGYGNHLKQKSLSAIYAQQIASRLESYSAGALLSFSQQMYRMVQNGDDNAIRTMETGRYYITTAAGVTIALNNGNPVEGLSRRVAKASSHEFTLYGTKSLMSDKQLSATVNNSKRLTRELDSQIADVKNKLSSFGQPENLDKFSRMKYDRLSSQLEKLQAERISANKTFTLHQHLQSLRCNEKIEKELLEKLKTDGKLPKNPKKLREASQEIMAQSRAEVQKRYKGLKDSDGKILDPLRITDRSLKKQIDVMEKHGKSLKTQIKMLEGKGSSLSQAERKLLMKLKSEVKTLGVDLAKYKGLLRARAGLDAKNSALDNIVRNAYKNKGRISNGLYALQSFMLRPLQAGYESNTEGLARGLQIASNRYVQKVVKTALKVSYKSSLLVAKTGMNMVAPGSVDAINTAMVPIKAGIQSANLAVRSGVKTAVQTGLKAAGNTISSAVPTGIKTGVKSASVTMNTMGTGIKNAVFRAKHWAAGTRVGRGLSAIARFNTQAAEILKSIGAVVKGIASKALLAIGGFFLILMIVSFISMLGGATGSSIIAAPNEKDGKIDLSEYVQIISAEQTKFSAEIDSYRKNSSYDNVFVNYSGPTSNSKQMLSMMAVRMSQDLDLTKNPQVEKYLVSLFKDSHVYTKSERHYTCSGCKEKTQRKQVYNSQTDSWEYVYEIDPDTGLKTVVWETVKYCPGHVDLTINISVLVFDEIFSADTYANSGQTANAGEKIGDFKITYYCIENYPHICNNGDASTTATGTKPTPGRTIAVDPSVIPLGSHVIIDGHEYIAEDTGGAIKGNRIDIVVAKHQEALNKGTRTNVPVYNPSYEGGSYEETGKWEGWTEDNIEWCKLIYEQDWTEIYTGFTEYGDFIESGDLIVSGDFTWPVTSTTITSEFGYRQAPTAGASTYHKGVDIGVPTGTPVHASAAGTVTVSSYQEGGAGYYVVIDHGNGIVTKYMHHSQNLVSAGQRVEAGQVIALSGSTGASTGPHLHFQFEVNGTPINPRKQFGI